MTVKAQEKAIEIIVRIAPDTPIHLKGDPTRIRQILTNFMSNAIKFTEKGYVLITVACENSFVIKDHTYHSINISIEDTGIGISKKHQDILFKKFTQVDASTTRKYGGTGLGLAICRELAEMMGGDVGFSSTIGKGSTFWFQMNLEESDRVPENDTINQSILKGLNVLVVDDIHTNCVIIQEQLNHIEMNCDTLTSSVDVLDAMDKAHQKGKPYDMVILDYIMPDLNGEALAKAIRSSPTISHTPLILISSERGREGANLFNASLMKPIFKKELIATLVNVWNRYSQPKTSDSIGFNTLLTESKVVEDYYKNTKVILAEDNLVNQLLAVEILKSFGCIVECALNGKEAISLIKQSPNDFHMIFMDCQMPEMDGFEASQILAKMKVDGELPDIPIVALTANAMKGDRERCLDAGMNDYISKPLRKNDIEDKLKMWAHHTRTVNDDA
jgi:CheY-like chemotaxis protein